MNVSETLYLYLITESEEDFITTSFEHNGDIITIYNFNSEIDPNKISFLAMDYSNDVFVSFNGRYKNSNALSYFKSSVMEFDIDRMLLIMRVEKIDEKIDLLSYKRDIKINNIIN